MNQPRRYALVLSVYFNRRGFAFVLFEGPLSPFDWGIRDVRAPKKQKALLAKIARIVDHYHPEFLVLEDTSPGGTRRVAWLVTINASLAKVAANHKIPVFSYSRDEVYGAFQSIGFLNKHTLAQLIAKHIPAFERYVPPPRKPWMSEDRRMSLFDAAALGLVFFKKAGGQG